MAGSTPPDDDDAALFRDAIGAVRRLQETPLPPRKAPPKPAARMAERDEDDALSEFQRGLAALDPHAAGDVLSYRREALSTRAFHRLKRGFVPTYDRWDRPIVLDRELQRAFPDHGKGKPAHAGPDRGKPAQAGAKGDRGKGAQGGQGKGNKGNKGKGKGKP